MRRLILIFLEVPTSLPGTRHLKPAMAVSIPPHRQAEYVFRTSTEFVERQNSRRYLVPLGLIADVQPSEYPPYQYVEHAQFFR